ncbi:AAA family ATPase [Nocardioides sp. GXQ0305]|uniref:AAA family ATPase n=1 Tax=Nocardioides sp. GXQ0305 TaxID=3423912 RepID=UPI003D7D2026
MLTLDSLAALTGADEHPTRPDAPLQGECPVCGRRRYLEALPFEDGTALVRCLAGCKPREVLTALRVDERDVRLTDDALGFEVSHDRTLRDAAADPLGALALSRGDLDRLPEPEPLIAETIDLRTVALLAGAPASRKSFVALDWCASVATGSSWQGRTVRQGRVLYVAGEGAYGLGRRLAAWEITRGTKIPDEALTVLPEPVQLSRPEHVERLKDYVERGGFSLVVIDTLARASVGVDENSAEGMGRVIDAVERVKRATGDGTVLLVHHTGKDGRSVRGSGALEGAMDSVYRTFLMDGVTRLVRTKRKDGPPEDEHDLHAVEVEVDDEGSTSIVLDVVDETKEERRDRLRSNIDRAWVAWVHTFARGVATKADFSRVLREDYGIPRGSVHSAIQSLVEVEVLVNLAKKPTDTPRFVADYEEAKRCALLSHVEPFGLEPGEWPNVGGAE